MLFLLNSILQHRLPFLQFISISFHYYYMVCLYDGKTVSVGKVGKQVWKCSGQTYRSHLILNKCLAVVTGNGASCIFHLLRFPCFLNRLANVLCGPYNATRIGRYSPSQVFFNYFSFIFWLFFFSFFLYILSFLSTLFAGFSKNSFNELLLLIFLFTFFFLLNKLFLNGHLVGHW